MALISQRTYSGRNTTINVKGSLDGVIKAARRSKITTACFLNLLKN